MHLFQPFSPSMLHKLKQRYVLIQPLLLNVAHILANDVALRVDKHRVGLEGEVKEFLKVRVV